MSQNFDYQQCYTQTIKIEWEKWIINIQPEKQQKQSKKQSQVACLKLGIYESLILMRNY